jgi:hypothetical protein
MRSDDWKWGYCLERHPFLTMTNEMLKQLSRVIQDTYQTINSPDLSVVFASQEFKSALELNPKASETN